MKTKILSKIFILTFLICAYACDDDTKFITTSNDAYFTVTNLTTGEAVTNESSLSDDVILYVSNGDELEFTYTPKEMYSEYSYYVSFQIGNLLPIMTVSYSPYVYDYTVNGVPVDDYTVSCSAVYNGDNVSISDYGSVKIRVTQ